VQKVYPAVLGHADFETSLLSPDPSSSQTPATAPALLGEDAFIKDCKGCACAAAGTPVVKSLDDELLKTADDGKV
jgi:hypothetical protein